ncbi:Uncharacterised protein [Mycobacteroides abscessus subsp. abscessus]|nr:Uncharacterised protein [Mycobacteroides abscessus subsp. abscessus]
MSSGLRSPKSRSGDPCARASAKGTPPYESNDPSAPSSTTIAVLTLGVLGSTLATLSLYRRSCTSAAISEFSNR